MISKNEVKYIQSLSNKKNRDQHNVFVAEGPKLVAELLDNDFLPQIIYTLKKEDFSKYNDFEIKEISSSELQRLSHFDTSRDVLGIFPKRQLPSLSLERTISLMLDGIQDPGNLGTIIRTADWFGIRQIIASQDTADWYNAKVVQSTMGSIARVNVYYENLENILGNTKVRIAGARLNGTSLHDAEKLTEGILVIGNESKGIRPGIIPFIQDSITIPRIGGAESLNAAVATGILLSHLTSS